VITKVIEIILYVDMLPLSKSQWYLVCSFHY